MWEIPAALGGFQACDSMVGDNPTTACDTPQLAHSASQRIAALPFVATPSSLPALPRQDCSRPLSRARARALAGARVGASAAFPAVEGTER